MGMVKLRRCSGSRAIFLVSSHVSAWYTCSFSLSSTQMCHCRAQEPSYSLAFDPDSRSRLHHLHALHKWTLMTSSTPHYSSRGSQVALQIQGTEC